MATTSKKKDAPKAAKSASITAANQAASGQFNAGNDEVPAREATPTAANQAAAREVNAGNAGKMSRRVPSIADIARRAYELWQQRGGGHGDDQSDWHRAEEELRSRH